MTIRSALLVVLSLRILIEVVAAPTTTPKTPAKPIKQTPWIWGETIEHYGKGTVVRVFTLKPIYGPSDKSVRARLNGTSNVPGPVTGTTRVYGKPIFLSGYKLPLGKDLHCGLWFEQIGQTTINGILMDAWKCQSEPAVQEKSQMSLWHFGYR